MGRNFELTEDQILTSAKIDGFMCPTVIEHESFTTLLQQYIEHYQKLNSKAILISNETLHPMSPPIPHSLLQVGAKIKIFRFWKEVKLLCEKTNVDLNVIAYYRNPDSYLKSAYMQWNIRHKIYEGDLKTFEDWKKEYSPVQYSVTMRAMQKALGKNIYSPINFEKAKKDNIVFNFMNYIKEKHINSLSIAPIHSSFTNATDANNLQDKLHLCLSLATAEDKLPIDLRMLVNKHASLNQFLTKKLASDFEPPTAIYNAIDDKELGKINKILSKHNQDEFCKNLPEEEAVIRINEVNASAESEQIIGALLQMIISLEKRISFLENGQP